MIKSTTLMIIRIIVIAVPLVIVMIILTMIPATAVVVLVTKTKIANYINFDLLLMKLMCTKMYRRRNRQQMSKKTTYLILYLL